MSRGRRTVPAGAITDEGVEFILRELRLTAKAWQDDPEYDGTVTLTAASAYALLTVYDRAVGGTRKRKGRESGKGQAAAKAKAARVAYLRLHLIPTLGAKPHYSHDDLTAARAALGKRRMKQGNDTRLRRELADAAS